MAITGIIGRQAGQTLTYLGSAYSNGSGTTHNFGNFVAPKDGLMIVAFIGGSGNDRSVVSMSIGGNSVSPDIASNALSARGAVASREVAAGSRAVTVTLNAAESGGGSNFVGVWLLTLPAGGFLAGDDSPIGASNTSRSVTFNLPGPGFAVYAAIHLNGNPTAMSSATKREDNVQDGGTTTATFADKATASPLTNHSETASWSGNAGCRMVGASYR